VAESKYGNFDRIASRSDEREGLGVMPQSRRKFLIGAGAVLGTALPRGAVASLIADAALLASRTSWELELVQEVLDNYPALPVAKCIAMLSEAGM
jgi:hypothetical protein